MFLSSCPCSDAVREVNKYSGPESMQDAKVNPNVYDHVHMKLFRAQRNLYISGFSIFLWLLVSFLSTFIKNNGTLLNLPTQLSTCLLHFLGSCLVLSWLFLFASGSLHLFFLSCELIAVSCVELSPC